MRRSALLVALSGCLGLSALRCSSDEGTLPNTGGSANGASVAGTGGSASGHGGAAGSSVATGGASAGTPGGSGAGAGGASAAGGTLGAGTGGMFGGASGSAGVLAGGAGSSGASGTAGATGGRAGGANGGAGFGFGGRGGNGGMSASGGMSAGMSGSGAGGATSAFAPVRAILTTSCGTKDCHVNDKGQHANLHDDDGKLLERLLSTTTKIVGAKDACATLPLVVPGNPDMSLIMAMIVPDDAGRTDCGKRMPDDCAEPMAPRECLTDPQIETIRSWIAAGAQP